MVGNRRTPKSHKKHHGAPCGCWLGDDSQVTVTCTCGACYNYAEVIEFPTWWCYDCHGGWSTTTYPVDRVNKMVNHTPTQITDTDDALHIKCSCGWESSSNDDDQSLAFEDHKLAAYKHEFEMRQVEISLITMLN